MLEQKKNERKNYLKPRGFWLSQSQYVDEKF